MKKFLRELILKKEIKAMIKAIKDFFNEALSIYKELAAKGIYLRFIG